MKPKIVIKDITVDSLLDVDTQDLLKIRGGYSIGEKVYESFLELVKTIVEVFDT